VVDQDTFAERKMALGQTIAVLDHDLKTRDFTLVGVAEYGVDNRANGWTLVGLLPDVTLERPAAAASTRSTCTRPPECPRTSWPRGCGPRSAPGRSSRC